MENTKPGTQLWFMPWRWPLWSRLACSAAVLLLPFVYFLSAMPAAYFSNQLALPTQWNNLILDIYHPVWWCRENSQVASRVIDWEDKLLVEAFGNWNYPL